MDFHFGEAFDAIASAIPDREAIVFRDRRFSFAQLAERSRRFANVLVDAGLRVQTERSTLAGHESGQPHLAMYAYNGNEYIEGMLGAFRARVAPLNVNYRYVEEELLYLFQDSQAKAILYHAEFAQHIASVRDRLPDLELLIQIADDSGEPLLPGAVDYEAALAAASPDAPDVQPSPDDLYILYTGGTTGMPKGVLWRSADIHMGAMGGRRFGGAEMTSLAEIAEAAEAGPGAKFLVGPPLMHGAAQWGAFINFGMGNGVAFPNDNKKLDPDDFLSTVERERAASMMIVGDAFARPLLDQLAKKEYDLSSLLVIASGGAPLSTAAKKEFLERLPNVTIMDSIGSSETGAQATNPSNKDTGVSTGDFKPLAGAAVVSADLTGVLAPGDDEVGWFAQQGRVPLGYFRDAEKTQKTFPMIAGTRYAVPGDRARYREDGSIEVLGRDSVTINSGGEKIYAEEVEHALKQHSGVFDVVVAGRPSERWGQEVVAVVALREGAVADEPGLLSEAGKHLARYKLPKAFVFCDVIQRSPSGKADYRWAKAQVEAAQEQS
ncbi:MAG: acyl-CoA synthetase [bacterium]|nr:acyl-CoA synthetase [bacterium]MCP5069405.1 acyl-CoA synthetase [bacterium]